MYAEIDADIRIRMAIPKRKALENEIICVINM